MTLKRKIKVLIVSIAIFNLIVFLVLNTRQVYWHNIYWNCDKPDETDAEYLDVYDLRFIFDTRDKKEIEELGNKLVNDSFLNNGEITSEYNDVISSDHFKRINPRDDIAKYKEDIIDEDFTLEETDALVHGDKAIFFYGYSYYAKYDENGTASDRGHGYEGYPNRIYLKSDGNKWVVQSVFLAI